MEILYVVVYIPTPHHTFLYRRQHPPCPVSARFIFQHVCLFDWISYTARRQPCWNKIQCQIILFCVFYHAINKICRYIIYKHGMTDLLLWLGKKCGGLWKSPLCHASRETRVVTMCDQDIKLCHCIQTAWISYQNEDRVDTMSCQFAWMDLCSRYQPLVCLVLAHWFPWHIRF